MARGSNVYSVGNVPPQVEWTVVRGDTAAFRVYVTDDAKSPLNIPDWEISAKIKRPTALADAGVITDAASVIFTLTPEAQLTDGPGEFTVSLLSSQSLVLQTGDIFDVQLTDPLHVWTVCQGKLIILEDVTD
jgi:hypothetical protein